MKRCFLLSVIFLLLFSCQTKFDTNSKEQFLSNKIKVDHNNVPLDSTQFYFPIQLFTNKSNVGQDTFVVSWYSKMLYAMREPLLYNRDEKGEIFRFTWLRTFNNPVAIRIIRNNEDYKISWKMCDGLGGYEPGELIVDTEKKINKKTWDDFQILLKKTNFWNMSTTKDDNGADGSQWILEATDSIRYHVVDRWSPKNNNYYQCCFYLIRLTDIKDLNARKSR
jgi:hypothetical protein